MRARSARAGSTPWCSTVASGETLRFEIRPSARLVSRVLIFVMIGCLVLMDTAMVFAPDVETRLRIEYIVLATVGMVPYILYMERRLVRAFVLADAQGLHIYNGLRTHLIAWTDVEGFQGRRNPFLVAVKRRGERPLVMTGVTPGLFGD